MATRCITIVLFFIVSVPLLISAEARSLYFNPISPDSVPHKPISSSHVTVSLEQTRFNDDGGACKGLDRTECVAKTTMVAHTDYVYTQDINGP